MLVAAILGAAPLVGTVSPAVAADPPEQVDNSKVYKTEAAIVEAMEKWAPVKSSESVMGYPMGIDQDAKGNIKSVALGTVQDQYDVATALKDAKQAAQDYADGMVIDKDGKKVPRVDGTKPPRFNADAARQIADSSITDPETTQSTSDNNIAQAMSETNSAKSYCNGSYHYEGAPQNTAKANPCIFVGKLDPTSGSKYPKVDGGSGIAGGGKKTYTVGGQVTEENSSTSGWSVGGKFTPKLTSTPADGGTGGEGAGELSFTYSYSSTSLNRQMTSQEDKTEVEFPAGAKGSLQGRRDGAYYIGYLFVDYQGTEKAPGTPEKEHLKAIPARVYVQSAETSTPVTYFKYQETAPQ
ncbi:hypothetical protein HXP44_03200 [Streptomyces sioyaensis]|uniref:Uncharacterized protein n=1 Tax=Streptomyces sioyaensis TaxID=67364 RepID=A0A4Q1QTV8_9ACTN|nr:hypothetical protein [Streptomyces sioyaensis]MBM4791100.1 hypothetical protein [Streptomyces sioyaensis]RXS59599.1 hypothetical protein EST54_29500 [Streptomyces sioyaensis]